MYKIASQSYEGINLLLLYDKPAVVYNSNNAVKENPVRIPGYNQNQPIVCPFCFYANAEYFKRRLLLTTLTLLSAMAAPAIIGSSRKPFTGYNTPAAIGIPMRL